eukprot:COSAG04_NODE_2482_length_4041_cov_4.531710_4_plen_312_part_00
MAKKRGKKKTGKSKGKKVVYKRRRRRRVGLPAHRVLENNQFRQLDSRLAGLEGRQYSMHGKIVDNRFLDFQKAQMAQNEEFMDSMKKLWVRAETQVTRALDRDRQQQQDALLHQSTAATRVAERKDVAGDAGTAALSSAARTTTQEATEGFRKLRQAARPRSPPPAVEPEPEPSPELQQSSPPPPTPPRKSALVPWSETPSAELAKSFSRLSDSQESPAHTRGSRSPDSAKTNDSFTSADRSFGTDIGGGGISDADLSSLDEIQLQAQHHTQTSEAESSPESSPELEPRPTRTAAATGQAGGFKSFFGRAG